MKKSLGIDVMFPWEFGIIMIILGIIFIILGKDLNEKGLDKFKIQSKQPDTLLIGGLSLFLSDTEKLNVKVVNKDVVLFKSIDQEKNYSESGIITRKTGELIHEITRNIKSENAEKYISIYSCNKLDQKV